MTGNFSGDALAAGQAAEMQAALSRARALLAPRPDPGLAEAVRASVLLLDPAEAKRVEREARYRANYGKPKKRDGRRSGWKRGQPKCPSCDEFLSQLGGWCAKCQTFDGNHDHGR